MEITYWCSLYCTGSPAGGNIEIDYGNGQALSFPVCDECIEQIQLDPQKSMDIRPDDVLEF